MMVSDQHLTNSDDRVESNLERLRRHGISHIVNVTQDVSNHFESSGITYLRIPVLNVKGERFEVELSRPQLRPNSSVEYARAHLTPLTPALRA